MNQKEKKQAIFDENYKILMEDGILASVEFMKKIMKEKIMKNKLLKRKFKKKGKK